ncbi:hypothetical protein U879_02210 [Defluviimonas sp. 20V17]|uniref:Copper chaperone PCu(A)C n=1 Tax=Allgaiera indica TaxID=765699 RepID=A0AAN4UTW2_9RHOB|nr:copper chaperone PCu(A)C [Allgaiera indica]KDB05309.1 hypothetical protein U879_02210 [Defluviimonas sp. 20V17]GHE04837.1 hypothetical protein GCM10008024_33540 [Allgaiera indica]SDX52943.1 hypothetical protein SAMN05444006_11924 [Allgaiera indica]
MTFVKSLLLAGAIVGLAGAVQAGAIVIKAPYARVSTPMSKSAAAFMEIENSGADADRLIGVTADVSAVAELHTHEESAGGVMRMVEVKGGILVPAHGSSLLARGGDHVMLMGLKHPLKQGDVVHLTLSFQRAGAVEVDVPVDNTRQGPMAPMKMGD